MSSTTNTDVIIGADTHKDRHAAVAISTTGLHLTVTAIPATSRGYQALETWAATFGTIRSFGMEGTGSYGAEFRKRFVLTYHNEHELPPGDYPMERLLADEAFSEMVEVTRSGTDKRWVHQIRTLVLTDPEGQPDCLVLIINDKPSGSMPRSGSSGPSTRARRLPSSYGCGTCAMCG